jgi:polysaccharide biosynthesis/export protein
MNRLLTACLALAAALAVGGCGSSSKPNPRNEQISNWIKASQANLPPGVYRVQPPDVIKVHAPRIKEIDGQGGKIRSDGKVVFNLIGPIDVAGQTTHEIAETLAIALRKYYAPEALDIAVEVTEFNSKAVYVFGEVFAPGPKAYTGRDTVLSVLADTGFTNHAWIEKVVLVRPNEDPNVRQKITLDVVAMYEKGDTARNILLEEGDVIYVPPTPLAELTATIEKILIPIRPVGTIAVLATGGI